MERSFGFNNKSENMLNIVFNNKTKENRLYCFKINSTLRKRLEPDFVKFKKNIINSQ